MNSLHDNSVSNKKAFITCLLFKKKKENWSDLNYCRNTMVQHDGLPQGNRNITLFDYKLFKKSFFASNPNKLDLFKSWNRSREPQPIIYSTPLFIYIHPGEPERTRSLPSRNLLLHIHPVSHILTWELPNTITVWLPAAELLRWRRRGSAASPRQLLSWCRSSDVPLTPLSFCCVFPFIPPQSDSLKYSKCLVEL